MAVVANAGWNWVNGTYIPISQHEGQLVYKNSNGFLLSYEVDGWHGWVLGYAGHPLYVAADLHGTWSEVPGWGKEPAPQVSVFVENMELQEAKRAAAAWCLDRAVEALARKDWQSLEGHLACAAESLEGEAKDSVLQVEFQALRAASEERAGGVEEELLKKPSEVGDSGRSVRLIKAAEAMKEGDLSKEAGHIFKADEWYSDGLQILSSSSDPSSSSLRSSLLLRRARVLQQKWQHKEVLDDCRAALETCRDEDRQELLLLAAEACKSLHEKSASELSSISNHWMQIAVHYLESACAPGDHALQRRLRSWKRQLPPAAKPVPMPPFDWSTLSMAEKAKYFGDVKVENP